MRPRLLLAALALLFAARNGQAMPIPDRSEPVPIARLVENVSRYIKKHPQDAEGYYTLARIHSIAFAARFVQPAPTITIIRGASGQEEQVVGRPQNAIKAIPADSPNSGNSKLPIVEGYGSLWRDKPNVPPSSEDLFHLRESVRYYARATALAPKDDYCWLGFGWTLEEGAPNASRLGTPWNSTPQKRGAISSSEWLNRALGAYRRVYKLNVASELAPGYHGRLSVEAGESILRIQDLPNRTLTRSDQAEIKRIQVAVSKIKEKRQPISPIILPLGRETSLQSLLSPRKSVAFDLSGDNGGKRWPWVGIETGILVWDPRQSGKITSGRQLFGSVTWWIFWKNGYQALASLDNDGDGSLTGPELNGISIWRDANGNGVSDFGEVKPLKEWNISSLSTRAIHQVLEMPANLRGAMRFDGTSLPTYDWTPRSRN